MSKTKVLTTTPDTDLTALPGSNPLRNVKHEAYCRERALQVEGAIAYRRAGFESIDHHAARGNAAKLERRADVQDRIAFLCRQDEEILREKRRRLESYLWLAHETNRADFYETVEEPVTKNGVLVLDGEGKPEVRRWQRLKLFSDLTPEQQALIEGVKYTEGGPALDTVTRQWANQELRKFLGTDKAGRGDGDDLARLSDSDLLTELARQARDLGIDVQLTYGIRGDGA